MKQIFRLPLQFAITMRPAIWTISLRASRTLPHAFTRNVAAPTENSKSSKSTVDRFALMISWLKTYCEQQASRQKTPGFQQKIRSHACRQGYRTCAKAQSTKGQTWALRDRWAVQD
jgi:hypothetical protein